MPIRLNSKRVKNKNLVKVFGRPLFCWLAETADKLDIPFYIFTNYEKQLKSVIDFKPKNILFLERSKSLDKDSTLGIDIYKEFCNKIKSDIYLLLHCTSPFLSLKNLKKTINAVYKKGYNSALTVDMKQTFTWYKGKPLNFSNPRPRTQDIEPVYFETSGAYCFKRKVIENNHRVDFNSFKFIKVGFQESIDIDNYED